MKYFWYLLILVGFVGAKPKQLYVPQTVWVGGSGGYLNLGAIKTVYSLNPGDTVRVIAGSYDGFYIENSRFTDSVYFYGSDSGSVFHGTCQIVNCKSIVFAKLQILNFSSRGFQFENNSDSITVRNCRVEHGTDFFINMFESGSNRWDNWIIKNDTFRACGFANVINTQGATTKNFTISNNIFDSTYAAPGAPGACISVNAVADKYMIYNNKFTTINKGGTDHNSVCYLAGNGKFFNNLCVGRQGDLVRFRDYWIDSSASKPTMDTTYCYNNRDCSAVKYASFELNQLSADTTTNTNTPNIRTGFFIGFNNTTLNGRTANYTPWTNSSGGGSGQWDVYTRYRGDSLYNNIAARMYIDSVPNPLSPPPAYTFNYQFHDGGGTRPAGYTGRVGDTSHNIYIQVAASMSANWIGNDSTVMNIIAGSVPIGRGNSNGSRISSVGFRGNTRLPVFDGGADQFDTYFLTPVPFNVIKTVR